MDETKRTHEDYMRERNELLKKKSKLVEITKTLVGEERVSESEYFSVLAYSLSARDVISVNHCENRIIVDNKHYLPRARQLRDAFEDATGEEFTIKKDYL